MRLHLVCPPVFLAMLFFDSALSLGTPPVFQGLTAPPGSLGSESYAAAVSSDGSTVVGAISSGRGYEGQAFVWKPSTGSAQILSGPGFHPTSGRGVSADGSVIVGIDTSSSPASGFHWSTGSGYTRLIGTPNAWGVSDDGTVVAGSAYGWPNRGYRWTAATGFLPLGDLAGGEDVSQACGISRDGQVIVGISGSTQGVEAFRWTQTTGMVGLGDLPGGSFLSNAEAASADGSFVVGTSSSSSGLEAFRWSAQTGMVGLGDLPGGDFGSYGMAVSADGSVVVGSASIAGTSRAYVWDAAHGMRDLQQLLIDDFKVDLSSWNLLSAISVSADGRTIVGYGLFKGSQRAYIAVVPEPYTCLLLGLLLPLGVIRAAIRRRVIHSDHGHIC